MLNKVFLLGNLGGDPEVKFTKDGVMMVVFRVATNEFIRSNGSFEKVTEWHTVCAFGKLAEFCSKLKKGDRVFIEGKLRTSSFEIENRVYRVSNIIAKSVKLIPRGIRQGEILLSAEEEPLAELDFSLDGEEQGNGAVARENGQHRESRQYQEIGKHQENGEPNGNEHPVYRENMRSEEEELF